MSNRVAGIDVHKKVLMVVVMDTAAPEAKPERRRFSTMPTELHHLSTWLRERGVEEAVMARHSPRQAHVRLLTASGSPPIVAQPLQLLLVAIRFSTWDTLN